MITRRAFLQGLLGTALTPLAAKSEMIWVPEQKLIPIVSEVADMPTRWCIMCEDYHKAVWVVNDIRQQLNRAGVLITGRRERPNVMEVGDMELWFYNANGAMEHLLGCEFTGAYFIGDIPLEVQVMTLMRTRRWPHYKQLPAGFEWPQVNETIEKLLRAV